MEGFMWMLKLDLICVVINLIVIMCWYLSRFGLPDEQADAELMVVTAMCGPIGSAIIAFSFATKFKEK